MQIALKERPIEFREYLGLDVQVLETHRLTDAVQLMWAHIPVANMRIAILLAPLGMAWGVQFWLGASALAAVEESVSSDKVAGALGASIERFGFQAERLPRSLFQTEAFGREQRLWIGAEAVDFPHAIIRTVLVPDDALEFSAFLNRLRAYIDQLGRFFLLPVPVGVELQSWQFEVDVRLTELLSGRPGGLKRGQSTEAWEGAIRLALTSLDGDDAASWLTPAFLESEQVETGYPIRKEGVSLGARAAGFLSMLNMRPIGEQLASRNAVTKLKLQLIKKWRWPLGLRALHSAQTSRDYRNAMLRGGEPCEEAEALVAEILEEGRRRYPVLFE